MIELTLLALINRLTNWGLAPVIVSRTVAADAATLRGVLPDAGGEQRLAGQRVWVTWLLTPGRGTTEVDLAVQFESRGLATRLLLALGGRRWIAARLNVALAALATTCARAAEDLTEPPPCAGRRRRTARATGRMHTHPR